MIAGISRALSIVGVVLLIGLLPWISGSRPEYTILRARYADLEATPENLAAIRTQLGLDQGPLKISLNWFSGLLHGDAGTSWISGKPVAPQVFPALGVSLSLMGWALVVGLIIATLLCIPAVVNGIRGNPRRGSGALAVLLTALPEFLLAAVLLVVFAVLLGWFPPYGWRGPEYVVLPALAMGIPTGGYLGRLFSEAITGTFTERWVDTWRMAGVKTPQLLLAVLRRALTPVISQVGLSIIGLTGGAVAVEQVFAIPGLGRLTLSAASSQDIPTLQFGVLVLVLLAVAVGALSGLARRLLLGPAARYPVVPVKQPQRYRRPRDLVVPVTVFTVLVVMVLSGLPRDPYTSVATRLADPSWALPFGADSSGRDLLARVAHGAVSTVGTALVVVAVCLVIGLILGCFPQASTGPTEIANAAPPVIAGLIVAAVMGPGMTGAAIAVAAVSWAPLAAHTSSLVTEVRNQPHVVMLPVLGVGKVRAMLRHILPSVIPTVARHAALRLPGTALSLAALGFLGLGSQPPAPEWGLVLSEGIDYVERAPWAVLAPATALILVSMLAVSLSSLPPRRRETTATNHSQIQASGKRRPSRSSNQVEATHIPVSSSQGSAADG
ncbi:ABC transporter permease subunit [Corynebacterium sp. S7]